MDELVRKNRIQCMCALISCAIVVVCVCIGVTMNLTTLYDQNFDNMGIRTFCMFTVNSNILAALSCFIVIPYAIDGIRQKEYLKYRYPLYRSKIHRGNRSGRGMEC